MKQMELEGGRSQKSDLQGEYRMWYGNNIRVNVSWSQA